MQFVHKLVRVGAQGIDVIHHAVDALHQLADFGFVAEGGDGAYHPLGFSPAPCCTAAAVRCS